MLVGVEYKIRRKYEVQTIKVMAFWDKHLKTVPHIKLDNYQHSKPQPIKDDTDVVKGVNNNLHYLEVNPYKYAKLQCSNIPAVSATHQNKSIKCLFW